MTTISKSERNLLWSEYTVNKLGMPLFKHAVLMYIGIEFRKSQSMLYKENTPQSQDDGHWILYIQMLKVIILDDLINSSSLTMVDDYFGQL